MQKNRRISILETEKKQLRSIIYKKLIQTQISNKDCKGRIPQFKGADIAAENLRSTPEWKESKTIFVSPDTAIIKVRENALLDHKNIIMASPKLLHGYLLIKPEKVSKNEREASTIQGAFKYGKQLETFPKVDMVVEGSVAVDLNGGRLGKGMGYGDREIEFLKKTRSIDYQTTIVSLVHDLQIVETVPMEVYDQKINMVVTPERILRI